MRDWKNRIYQALKNRRAPVDHTSLTDNMLGTIKCEPGQIQIKTARGLDFSALVAMEPETEMMAYVQAKANEYAQATDTKYPDGRVFVGSLVGGCVRYVPCGSFNKDNSCPMSFVHPDLNGEQRIHSCALCYFALCGMINLHRLSQCPLLSYI